MGRNNVNSPLFQTFCHGFDKRFFIVYQQYLYRVHNRFLHVYRKLPVSLVDEPPIYDYEPSLDTSQDFRA
jgi:hypothetical protein